MRRMPKNLPQDDPKAEADFVVVEMPGVEPGSKDEVKKLLQS
jgi:hypothetical protein